MNNLYLLKRQLGFTLLEVLIAIGITALIGLGTWQLLSGTIRGQEITQKNSERFEKLQKMMVIVSRDIKQLNSRAVRDEFGDYQPAITNQNTLYLLELTRSGWRNPSEHLRSDLQRVSYELVDGELLRHYWKVLDRAQDSESVYQVLLNDIDSMAVRFMSTDNQWTDTWPPVASPNSNPRVVNHLLPRAVELTIEHNYFGTLVRLYDLPQYIDVSSSRAGGGGSGSGSGSSSGSNGTNNSQNGSSQSNDNTELESTSSDGDQ